MVVGLHLKKAVIKINNFGKILNSTHQAKNNIGYFGGGDYYIF